MVIFHSYVKLPEGIWTSYYSKISGDIPGLVNIKKANWNIAIEIVDLPSYKMVMFHSYVSLPEGRFNKKTDVMWLLMVGVIHHN